MKAFRVPHADDGLSTTPATPATELPDREGTAHQGWHPGLVDVDGMVLATGALELAGQTAWRLLITGILAGRMQMGPSVLGY